MTRYIDQHKENHTTEEVLALASGSAKPYPQTWYTKPQSIITRKNANLWDEYQELKQALELDSEADVDYSWFTCPVNKFEYISCSI